MSVRITCINKEGGNHYDPHEAIAYLGWTDEASGKSGKSSRLEIVDFIEKQGGVAYTKDSLGGIALLVVKVSPRGNKYVKTVADGRENNNLLALIECK